MPVVGGEYGRLRCGAVGKGGTLSPNPLLGREDRPKLDAPAGEGGHQARCIRCDRAVAGASQLCEECQARVEQAPRKAESRGEREAPSDSVQKTALWCKFCGARAQLLSNGMNWCSRCRVVFTVGEGLLLQLARLGDESALSELHTLYFRLIYRYGLVVTGSSYEAEKLSEDVWARMLPVIESSLGAKVSFAVALFRVAREVVANASVYQRLPGESVRVDTPPLDESGNWLVLNEIMFGAQAITDEQQRETVALRFAAGLTVKEAALGRCITGDSMLAPAIPVRPDYSKCWEKSFHLKH